MPNIKLQSSDEEIFEVDVEVARMSVTLRTMLDDLGIEEDDGEPIPVQNVNSSILRKVIQWATYHKNDPPTPEDDDQREKVCCKLLVLISFQCDAFFLSI